MLSDTPDGSYPAAVEYEGKIYSAHYDLDSGYKSNIDPSKDTVECYLVNDTAADYVESEIKRYGKLDTLN